VKRAISQRLGESNRRLVLNHLRRLGVASMDQLVRETGRSQPTVLKWLDSLERAGAVRRRGVGASSGGRPPTLFEYLADAGHVLGVAVEIPSVTLTLLDLRGQVLAHEAGAIAQLGPSEVVLRELHALVERFAAGHLGNARTLVGAGLAMSGFIDRDVGLSLATPRLSGWEDVPVRRELERWLEVPVVLNHHIDALTQAELHVGSALGVDDFLFFDFGYGLGLRAVRGGQPLVGRFGNAGLIGHTTVVPDGRACLCGNRGCLEEYVSGRRLLCFARDGVSAHCVAAGEVSAHDEDAAIAAATLRLFDVAEDGDDKEVRDELERFLAIGLANAINTFDQPRVVLSGFAAAGGSALRERILHRTRALLQPTLAAASDITFSRLPRGEAGARGAALFALRQYLPFADPLVATAFEGGPASVFAPEPIAAATAPSRSPDTAVAGRREDHP
jgi:predicted NBD/HSP70 family sugar kinase